MPQLARKSLGKRTSARQLSMRWRFSEMAKYHLAIIVFCSCPLSLAQDQSFEDTPADLVPNAERLKTLESNPDDHPVVMLKLLNYKSETGRKSYGKYLESSVPRIRELGGEILFYGKATSVDSDLIDETKLFGWRTSPWDGVVLEKYRSRKDLGKLSESEDYRKGLIHRRDGLENTVVYALNGTRRRIDGVEPTVAAINLEPDHPPPAVYMLNLLRFKRGGENSYFEDYGKPVTELIFKKHHGKIIYGLKPEQTLIGEEQYDRVILVMYPSIEEFTKMIQSEEYQQISHYREDAIEVGHLFAFTSESEELKRLSELE
jgi:uncharacterized protein (DUF1330 family)